MVSRLQVGVVLHTYTNKHLGHVVQETLHSHHQMVDQPPPCLAAMARRQGQILPYGFCR